MNKTRGWDTASAQMGGQFESLTPGGHICKILRAEVGSSRNGAEMMILTMEISEGSQFDGFFRRQFDARKVSGTGLTIPKWPGGGMYYQLTTDQDGMTNPRFKGLIKAIEESNRGYAWNWDETTLKGKLVGMIYREEEFEANDGTIKTTVKAMACCPASEALAKEPPKKKLLNKLGGPAVSAGFTAADDDDDLPF